MGGCCCCFFSSRRSEPARTPTYCYRPSSEDREPLSANHGIPPGLAGGLLVDTNLDTSSPDTYAPSPAPVPCDVDLGRPRAPQGRENHITKSDTQLGAANSGSVEALNNADSLDNQKKDLKELDDRTQSELELNTHVDPDDLKKPVELNHTIIEEEDCPICLEEYTEENPKMFTKCDHDFHLCCILEWMERSDTCPICDKEVLVGEVLYA